MGQMTNYEPCVANGRIFNKKIASSTISVLASATLVQYSVFHTYLSHARFLQQ